MSRRLGLALAVLLALVVAGCGGLSSAGPVEPGLDVGSGNPPDVRVTFPGPVPGAGQESIVRGFVRAGQASDGAYDNARAFLISAVSERWGPDDQIVLLADDAPPSATLLDPATVRITAQAAGTVDADGRYAAAKPGSTVTATFSLATVGGEWRISALPEGFGRWIARSEVSRLVQPYAVHYVATSRRGLVPDVRWFPADKLATRLARAQLTEVPGHLTGTAVSAVPAGARLLGDAVSVDAGVATVNLISDRLLPGEANRQNLWAQFVGTLTQDSEVARVALAVNGVPVDLAGLDRTAGTLAEVGFSSPPPVSLARPVVRRGDDVTAFDPATLGATEPRDAPGTRSSYPPVPQDFTRLALSVDGSELAGVDPGGDGVSRWLGTNRYEVPLTGVDVGNPAYDRRGYLWIGAVGPGGAKAPRLWVVDVRSDPADPQRAAAVAVEAPWLEGRRVLE
ncbi:MAG TPA: GerMN domain-containing protein, partial [Ornithinibacter sp.]|nr:GerMN domain-containing protein [Ornithinibacter sp.]